MIPDISEAQIAQSHLMLAAQTIVRHNLPLTTEGATECERIMRAYGIGNRRLWAHANYLPPTIALAQEIVRYAREPVPDAKRSKPP